MDKIIYTHTDEAPALATYALLPIIQRFAKPLGVSAFLVIRVAVFGAHFLIFEMPKILCTIMKISK